LTAGGISPSWDFEPFLMATQRMAGRTEPPRPRTTTEEAAHNVGHQSPGTHRSVRPMRKEIMSGIWHSPELKPKAATQSPRKTITSTPNTISELCRRTERNSRKVSSSIRCENTGADATGSVRRRSKFLLISDLRLGGTRIRGRSQNAGIVRIASPSNATLLAPRLGIVVGGDNRLEMHETRA
jgi:hypothetical protein